MNHIPTKEIEMTTISMTRPDAEAIEREAKLTDHELAEKCSDAYSTDSYRGGWNGCVKMLRKRGYDDEQIEAILRSKWTRWAGDGDEKRRYGNHTSTTLADFLDAMKPADLTRRLQELVDGTFFH